MEGPLGVYPDSWRGGGPLLLRSNSPLQLPQNKADSQLDFQLTCDILVFVHIHAFPNWNSFPSPRNPQSPFLDSTLLFDGFANWSEPTGNLGPLESINYKLPFL
jgi:hypothetical protein